MKLIAVLFVALASSYAGFSQRMNVEPENAPQQGGLKSNGYGRELRSALPFNQAAVKQSTAPAALGPSASSPYFNVRFALPVPPDNDWHANGHLLGIDAAVGDHHHSPGFEIMPNGDALMIPYSGPGWREGGQYLRIAQARLRYGAEEFDMPEELTVGGVRIQDLIGSDGRPPLVASPLLWREGSTVWLFLAHYDYPGEPTGRYFRVFKSEDSGVTWQIVALEPQFITSSPSTAHSQPIVNAFRAPNGDMFVATDSGAKSGGSSMLWRSSDNGLSWTDQGGRTDSRHSTIVPLNTSGTLLSGGGKDTNLDKNGVVFKDQGKNGYMPQNISTDWGVTWGAATQSPFPWLGGGQRPSMIRLASGNLIMVGDVLHSAVPQRAPSGWTHGTGPYVALSTNNGSSWTIKELPVALLAKVRLTHRSIGYATVRQAPNGLIHVLATVGHPVLHYEFNEAWITTPSAGDIAPETGGGTVQSYSETYSGGAPKATWSARRTPGGRYLLDGLESHYYADGKKQREVSWVSGRRTGPETLWGPDGTRIWSWNHDLANNVSTWTHWWSNGQKRLESQWDMNPVARARRADPFVVSPPDLSGRHFRGLVAHGTARHWNTSGQQVGAHTFLHGARISSRGNHTENFNTDPSGRGWTGSGNTAGGNNFGWSSTTAWAEAGNHGAYQQPKGEIGGVFARSSTYHWYADTNLGTRNRTQTLHLAGNFQMADVNFDGGFHIGYFNTPSPGSNFIGIEFREPAGAILDPTDPRSATTWFRAYLTVRGPGGTTSSAPMAVYMHGGGTKTFDLIWKGNPDGSGTLSGTVVSIPMPPITVAAGSGSFNAFGLLNGGMSSTDTTQITGGCWFDNLTYDKGEVKTYTVTYNANRAARGSVPSNQTKPHGVDLPLATRGDLVRTDYTFAGWNTAAAGSGTTYAPGASYTANADVTLYAKWAAIPSQTLRIMPMGDSITQGTVPGGYRLPLYNLLTNNGYTVDFVGAKAQSGDTTPDTNHWGQGGWQISDTPATVDGRSYVSIQAENRSGLYDEMSDAISTNYFSTNTAASRNIILLQIGINDILHQVVDSEYGSFDSDAGNDGQGEGQEWVAEGMIARLNALLQRIDSLAASRNLRIEVMLGTLCRPTKAWKGDAVSDVLINEVVQYNNFISSVIPTLVFSNISVKTVDQTSSTNGKLRDGVHPNSDGYAAMAQAWCNAITVTHSDVAYGPDKTRNRLDFWQASGSGPRPLLVNIHGGGWITGDKNGYFNYKPFLERGISCASINYRLTPDHPLPVPVHNAARAIQFLRSKAAEWNIDPDRIALTGGSAGACTAMWLLLHDDLADPKSKDPVLRQSSRVCAAYASAGQTSIDPPVISQWIPTTVPLHNMIPYAVGQPSMATVWPHANYENRYQAIYEEFSPINHLDANDPPLYMEYNRSMKLPARSDGDAIHHPLFGVKMWEKSNTTAAGHECHLRFSNSNNVPEYRKTTTTSYASGEEFLLDKLLRSAGR